MSKNNNIFLIKILFFILYSYSIIFANVDNIGNIKEKYLNHKKIEVRNSFGFIDNKKRSRINARGDEEYDLKGKKKKRGVSNVFFSQDKKINNISNKDIKKNNDEYFYKNYLNEEMSDEEYNDFIEELFKDYEV